MYQPGIYEGLTAKVFNTLTTFLRLRALWDRRNINRSRPDFLRSRHKSFQERSEIASPKAGGKVAGSDIEVKWDPTRTPPITNSVFTPTAQPTRKLSTTTSTSELMGRLMFWKNHFRPVRTLSALWHTTATISSWRKVLMILSSL